jgi:hypothetical protein
LQRLSKALAIGGAVAALGASASPALAATHTMSLSGPTSGVAGQGLIVTATGSNPPATQWMFPSFLSLDAIPANAVTGCPAGSLDGAQVAAYGGGQILATSISPNGDTNGNYTNLFGFTPRTPGRWLLCGYEDDGAEVTLAAASMYVDAAAPAPAPTPAPPAAPAPPPAKPAASAPPRVRRSGRTLVCDAGTWTGATSYAYRWLANGKRTGGAGAKLAITRKLRHRKVQCSVTATGAGGSASAVSRALRVG